MNAALRRAVRTEERLPNDKATLKLLFPILNHAEKEWIMSTSAFLAKLAADLHGSSWSEPNKTSSKRPLGI